MLFDQPGAGGAGDIAYIESNTLQPLVCGTNIVRLDFSEIPICIGVYFSVEVIIVYSLSTRC